VPNTGHLDSTIQQPYAGQALTLDLSARLLHHFDSSNGILKGREMLNNPTKKRTFVLIIIAFGIVLMSPGFAEIGGNTDLEEAKGIIGAFSSSLKAELQAALKAGGPTNATGSA